MFKVLKPKYNVFHLEFDTAANLCEAFVRIQEHYEGPEFQDKIFTLGQYRSWYALHAKENRGYSYNEDFTGFNIPDTALLPFRLGLFDPLTEQEKLILHRIPTSQEKFYVIGTSKEGQEKDKTLIEHEMAHALYYLDDKYRQRATKAVREYNLKALYKYLHSRGYASSVYEDEAQAYIGVDYKYLEERGVPYPKELRDTLIKLRKQRTK